MNTVITKIYLVIALSLTTLIANAEDTSTSNTDSTTNAGALNNTGSTDSTSSSDTTKNTDAKAGASNASASSIEGNYQCQRSDAANNTTSYPLTVKKANETYTFEWENANGDPVLYGTGVMHPNLTQVIASSFWDPRKPDAIGIQMFEIKPDGSLQSNWVLQADNQIGTETCTKSK